ncbi:MAG: PucR family transcriptional regulator [Clostridiales bacterium]|nr:PucR family transcriptional regulator [Clostridiales bacterium]
MSIMVSEAMQLNHLKPLNLIAGSSGLNKKIEKIGILDHEIIEGIPGMFTSGDFVLTTFTPIREDMDAIIKCIKDLIECRATALAIKSIYITELPQTAIDYANKHDFPIFIFGKDVYFEDVIEDLMIGMQSRSHIEILESKIDVLYKNELKPSLVKEMAFDLNRHLQSELQVFFLKEKRYINDTKIIRIAEKYKRSRHQYEQHSVFKYKEGLLVIFSYPKMSLNHVSIDQKFIFNLLGIDASKYYMGSSEILYDLIHLDLGIKQSIYASKVCELEEKDKISYRDIGIYKLLLPHQESIWIKRYVDDILDPINNYDDGKLIETARIYIQCGGDILRTSKEMFQHKNTIRYRIQKMKSLLNVSLEGDFYEQLSIAIKCERLVR